MIIVDFGKKLSHCEWRGVFPRVLFLVGTVLAGGCKDPMRGNTVATGGGVENGGVSSTGGAMGAGGATGMGGRAGAGGVLGSGGAPDATPSLDAQSCEALAATAAAQFQTYLDSTSALACQTDSDCKYLHPQSLNCFAACGVVVGDADVAAVTAATSGACQQYAAAQCPEIRLSCPVTQLACLQGKCGPGWRAAVDPAPDASPAQLDSAADSAVCSQPSEGAACTPEQSPCATCCTDHWSCVGGVWQNQFLGCLPTGFTCGEQSCSEGAQYCLHIPGRGGELPVLESYSCERLPDQCFGPRCPTCDCLKQAAVPFLGCTADAVGGIYVLNQPY
jgi:hypothetical protein